RFGRQRHRPADERWFDAVALVNRRRRHWSDYLHARRASVRSPRCWRRTVCVRAAVTVAYDVGRALDENRWAGCQRWLVAASAHPGHRAPGLGVPDFARGAGDECQLLALHVGGDAVALVRGREAALRAERQAVEWHERGGLLDAGHQVLQRLHARDFRTHQPEHDDAAVWDVAQRFECARPLIVVLEKETIELRPGEDLLGDPIVAAGRIEHALVVAPADVDAERHPGVSIDDRVVELHGCRQHLVRIAPALAVAVADLLVEQRRVLRGVDLNVLAAEAPQLRD